MWVGWDSRRRKKALCRRGKASIEAKSTGDTYETGELRREWPIIERNACTFVDGACATAQCQGGNSSGSPRTDKRVGEEQHGYVCTSN